MKLYILHHGIIDTNSYIIADGPDCAVIDCGVKSGDVMQVIEKNCLDLKYIILTHGHFDHVFHVKSLKDVTKAKVCLHESEIDLYRNPDINGFSMFGMAREMNLAEPDILLHDGVVLESGALKLRIIHTPGHTQGSICILSEDSLFSGDTLFSMSIGRTDLPTGSSKSLHNSITQKLFTLEDRITVYPGHGPKTTIGHEKANNPYV